MANKTYKIITKLEDDAPYGNVNWCTISFLDPHKIEKINYLDMKGFKVYNGYNVFELAKEDASKIKNIKKEHDIYISQIGKIYVWDDATKSDDIEYDDEKLNDLEKTRKENIDKMKLMAQQFKNEHKKYNENPNTDRKNKQIERLKNKLYEKGLISQKEAEMIEEEMKKTEKNKEKIDNSNFNNEIEECWKTDYLDESLQSALKYGCISIYSSRYIAGLRELCFKVRGLYQTVDEMQKAVKKLKKINPDDRIYTFEVGKWCLYTELDIEEEKKLKLLNFIMKCHIDNIAIEQKEFESRKETMKNQADKTVKPKSKKEKKESQSVTETVPTPIINPEDKDNIQTIYDFLDDRELTDKFKIDTSTIKPTELDLGKN